MTCAPYFYLIDLVDAADVEAGTNTSDNLWNVRFRAALKKRGLMLTQMPDPLLDDIDPPMAPQCSPGDPDGWPAKTWVVRAL